MAARRCSLCGLSWPVTEVYKTCPECEERTDYVQNDEPMLPGDAQDRLNHAKFARYYAETRGVPVDFDGDPADDPYRDAVEAPLTHVEAAQRPT